MVSDFWYGKRVVITGGAGFVGSHLVKALQARGCEIYAPLSSRFDLRHLPNCLDMLHNGGKTGANGSVIPIDILFNLAANVGGIGYNRNHPYNLFYDNIQINTNLIHASLNSVKKFVQIGTVCAYPKFAHPPFREETLWDGYPEETNAPYGLAKKMALVQLQAARAEFGFNGIYLLPTNLYGPGDQFSPDRSHVIPALIRKCIEARDSGADTMTAWGSGDASRDFLYVEDAVEAMILAAEKYDSPQPLNIGSGQEIRVAALLHLIMNIVGYGGAVDWDRNSPDGQPRRGLNISAARHTLGWEPTTGLRDGLAKTIEWYQEQVKVAA